MMVCMELNSSEYVKLASNEHLEDEAPFSSLSTNLEAVELRISHDRPVLKSELTELYAAMETLYSSDQFKGYFLAKQALELENNTGTHWNLPTCAKIALAFARAGSRGECFELSAEIRIQMRENNRHLSLYLKAEEIAEIIYASLPDTTSVMSIAIASSMADIDEKDLTRLHLIRLEQDQNPNNERLKKSIAPELEHMRQHKERRPQDCLLLAQLCQELNQSNDVRVLLRLASHCLLEEDKVAAYGIGIVSKILSEQASIGDTDGMLDTLGNIHLSKWQIHNSSLLVDQLINDDASELALLVVNSIAAKELDHKPTLGGSSDPRNNAAMQMYMAIAGAQTDDPSFSIAVYEQGLNRIDTEKKFSWMEKTFVGQAAREFKKQGYNTRADTLFSLLGPGEKLVLQTLPEGRELTFAELEILLVKCSKLTDSKERYNACDLLLESAKKSHDTAALALLLPPYVRDLEELTNDQTKAEAYLGLSHIYRLLGDTTAALGCCKKSVDLSTSFSQNVSKSSFWHIEVYWEYMEILALTFPDKDLGFRLGELIHIYPNLLSIGEEIDPYIESTANELLNKNEIKSALSTAFYIRSGMNRDYIHRNIALACSRKGDVPLATKATKELSPNSTYHDEVAFAVAGAKYAENPDNLPQIAEDLPIYASHNAEQFIAVELAEMALFRLRSFKK
jgi:hypothetical protein